MNLKVLFIIFFSSIFFCVSSYSQDKKYYDGYVVTKKNDTITGTIKMREEYKLCKDVVFKDYKGKKKWYYPRDLLSYSVAGFNYIKIPKCKGCNYGFCLFQTKGKINVYRESHLKSSTNSQGVHSSWQVERYYLEKGEMFSRIRKTNYKKVLMEFCNDDKGVLKQIDALTMYDYQKFQDIISDYNQ